MNSIPRRDLRTAVLIALFGCVSVEASAQPNFTLSVGLNRSSADAVPFPYHGPVAQTTLSPSSYSGNAPRLALDTGFSKWLRFEAGWSRFGSESGTVTHPGAVSPCAPICPGPVPNPPPGPPIVRAAEQNGYSYWIAYTPALIEGDWDVRAKLGLARVVRDTDLDGETFVDREESTTEPVAGIGATWWFSDRFGTSLEVESFGGRATQFGLSVAYRF